MGLVNVYPNNISLDDDNFDKDDPETAVHVRYMAWFNRHKQRKTCKESIFVAWHPTKWWD